MAYNYTVQSKQENWKFIKMKNLMFLVFIMLFSCNCKSQNKMTYYLNYNFSFPYEISVNDVLLEKDVFNGRSGPDRLNNYILNSRRQKITFSCLACY